MTTRSDSPMPIVALAKTPWDGSWMNRQQICSRLARRRRVVYSSGAPRTGSLSVRRASAARTPSGVLVHVPAPLLMRSQRFALVDRAVLALTTATLRRLAGGGPLIAYVFDPKFWPYIAPLSPARVVYHAYDLFARYTGYSEEAARWERSLVSSADLVIASSDGIARALSDLGSREVAVVPNGVEYETFAAAAAMRPAEPPDLAAIPRPRIGYAGALSRKVDFDLIAELARRQPQWHFTLVGPLKELDAVAGAGYDRCRSRPNVHFLGAKPYADIPRYIAGMDVNTMCYRMAADSWVGAGYPLKLHEYLATGIPVVSADLPSVRPYASVLAIASGADRWEQQIDEALTHGGSASAAERKAVARGNTWDARVAVVERLFERIEVTGGCRHG